MHNKTALYLTCIIMAVMLCAAGLTHAAWSPDFERLEEDRARPSEEITNVMGKVLDLFAPVNGIIQGVQNGQVTVMIDGEHSIMKGMRFTVFRVGEPFHHPLTNELIGETEHVVGRVEVIEKSASNDMYVCSIVEGDVVTGDAVRISSSKIKLAFFQDRKADWPTSEAFYNALKESGRFEILEAYAPVYEPKELSKLAVGLDAVAVMAFSTPVKNKGKSLNVKLYWAKDAKLFGEIEEQAGQSDMSVIAPEREFMFTDSGHIELMGSHNLSSGRLIAAGDVDGNGTFDYVVSDGSDIRIYTANKDDLHELWHIKGDSRGMHLALDLLDVNQNGIPEIFVTSMTGDRISSFVMEYGPSGYEKVSRDMPYFFRVVDHSLLMQRYQRVKFFSGSVYRGAWSNNTYKTGAALSLPPGMNIYGFAYIDWQNNAQSDVISFDDEGYLNLYDNSGALLWKSAEIYDMPYQAYRFKKLQDGDNVPKWLIRGNVVSVPTVRGHEIVLIKKIPNVKNLPGLGSRGGEVYSLWWDGTSMNEKMIVKEMIGSIGGFQVVEQNIFVIAQRSSLSLLKRIAAGKLSRGSLLYYFNLEKNED